jgi:hypothetical protein
MMILRIARIVVLMLSDYMLHSADMQTCSEDTLSRSRCLGSPPQYVWYSAGCLCHCQAASLVAPYCLACFERITTVAVVCCPHLKGSFRSCSSSIRLFFIFGKIDTVCEVFCTRPQVLIFMQIEDFSEEFQILRSFHHPNVVSFLWCCSLWS